ncbi:MAG: Gfo/Idh/MocA family oxidoreductase [Acidobacteriota bacterium]
MLSVAVVGFGAFGRNHARVYGTLPDARLAAIVDPDRSARAEAERLHPEAAILESIDLLGPIDAASIAVPTERHAAIAEGLLSRGVACLVEKPIAPSIAEADLILEASRRHGRPVFVGQLERFNPALLAARREIHDPRFIEVHRLGSFSPRSLDIDVVLDLMVHDLDVILTLAGAFPERVEAIGVNVLTAKVDIANARLGFASGLVANVTASRVSKERIRKLRIFQPHCYLSLDFANRAFELFQVELPRAGAAHGGGDRGPASDGRSRCARSLRRSWRRCAASRPRLSPPAWTARKRCVSRSWSTTRCARMAAARGGRPGPRSGRCAAFVPAGISPLASRRALFLERRGRSGSRAPAERAAPPEADRHGPDLPADIHTWFDLAFHQAVDDADRAAPRRTRAALTLTPCSGRRSPSFAGAPSVPRR